MRKVFQYVENLWIGADGQPSLRAVLAIAFSVDFIRNLSHAIWHWEVGRSLEGLSMVLGIEGGLIVGLLGLTAWSNVANKKIDSGDYGNTSGNAVPPIKVEKAETITVASQPSVETKPKIEEHDI